MEKLYFNKGIYTFTHVLFYASFEGQYSILIAKVLFMSCRRFFIFHCFSLFLLWIFFGNVRGEAWH